MKANQAIESQNRSQAESQKSEPGYAAAPVQRKRNDTGLPDNLKAGIENLSGYSMDDVKVHYNSSQPATLQAHAYAQGTDIHVAPGQERHVPHEAWHVVQQKQGRVKPTRQLKGKTNINDDAGLEHEADLMGTKALQTKTDDTLAPFASVMMAHADTAQLEGGNRVTETVKYGLGGLVIGAGLCWLIQQRPDIAGNTLLKLASVFLPTFLGGLKGYWEGAKLDEDEEEWKNLQPLLEVFPNHQPQNLENEIEAYGEQLKFDEGLSFIVSYKNRKEFERRLNTGEGFLWVFTTDKDLRIGSKQNNQHSVVGEGKNVYSAGEGVKPSKAGPVADLLGTIKHLQLKVDKVQGGPEAYGAVLEETKQKLRLAIQQAEPNPHASDIVHVNLRSGHYAPTIDMDRWKITVYAWKQAGYKAVMHPKGTFLPSKEQQEEELEDKKEK